MFCPCSYLIILVILVVGSPIFTRTRLFHTLSSPMTIYILTFAALSAFVSKFPTFVYNSQSVAVLHRFLFGWFALFPGRSIGIGCIHRYGVPADLMPTFDLIYRSLFPHFPIMVQPILFFLFSCERSVSFPSSRFSAKPLTIFGLYFL